MHFKQWQWHGICHVGHVGIHVLPTLAACSCRASTPLRTPLLSGSMTWAPGKTDEEPEPGMTGGGWGGTGIHKEGGAVRCTHAKGSEEALRLECRAAQGSGGPVVVCSHHRKGAGHGRGKFFVLTPQSRLAFVSYTSLLLDLGDLSASSSAGVRLLP